MTWLVALGPLALTPLFVWLLMEFGPERGVIFALYWLIPSIVFAMVFPILRRRGRSLKQASVFAIVWAIVITGAVFVGLFFGFTPATAAVPTVVERQDTRVRTPAAGSAARTAILDAVRKRLGVKSKFKVSHVRATDRWAFVRCVEVINDGEQLQETDLDIAALLERTGPPGALRWEVVDVWSLSTDDEKPYTPFARRVRERARSSRIPSGLFPEGFLTSDVPVE
jgi:hypothetical protein